MPQIAAKPRRWRRKHNIELIIVDHLQLINGSVYRDNRTQEITEVINGLKSLAEELVIPVNAVSQLSRNVEYRPDKRPMVADLCDSGSIEQDGDIVMFSYRERTTWNGQPCKGRGVGQMPGKNGEGARQS